MQIPHNAALIIIDVQQAIDHPQWARGGSRNNPQAEECIAQLLVAWCATQRPIVHVRHMSREEEVHAMSLANLQDEYAAIMTTRETLSAV